MLVCKKTNRKNLVVKAWNWAFKSYYFFSDSQETLKNRNANRLCSKYLKLLFQNQILFILTSLFFKECFTPKVVIKKMVTSIVSITTLFNHKDTPLHISIEVWMPLFVLILFVEFCLRPVYLVMVVEYFQIWGFRLLKNAFCDSKSWKHTFLLISKPFKVYCENKLRLEICFVLLIKLRTFLYLLLSFSLVFYQIYFPDEW